MRYFIFYQNVDGNIQCIITIISKNRCSLEDFKVLRFYSFKLDRAGGGGKTDRYFWPNFIHLFTAILLLGHYLRTLI